MTPTEGCKTAMAFLVFVLGAAGLFWGYPGIEASQVLWVSGGLMVAGAGAVGIKITSIVSRNGGKP